LFVSFARLHACAHRLPFLMEPHLTSGEEFLMISFLRIRTLVWILVLGCAALLSLPLRADNNVLGQVDLVGATKVERTSGVWIDGQYVGYLQELKGSKKLLLLPGEHEITVRQGGYIDFAQKVTVRAGETQTIEVKMEKDTRVQFPHITAQIKLEVNPNRAAVFVDGVFVGHVAEFSGVGRALLVAPGKRKIRITLPGYQDFETDIDLVANQKSTVKTDLVKGGPAEGTPLPQ
ncbi:MAG: PEGA domain-containing protein, partial [Candidatus Sulfotelmatobacter sp.]